MSRPPLPHAVTRLIPQRGTSDCAVACLAMYLRVDYEEALLAAARARPDVLVNGLPPNDIRRAAKRLGHVCKWARGYDLDDHDGILLVEYPNHPSYHTVLLVEGTIYDPAHNPISRWDHAEWLRYYHANVVGLLRSTQPIEEPTP